MGDIPAHLRARFDDLRKNDPEVTTFVDENADFYIPEATALAVALKDHPTVTTLDIGWNYISGAAGGMIIGDIIGNNKMLRTINVRHNFIGRLGVAYIGSALKTNPALVSIDLSQNRIGDDGTRMLLDGLNDNTNLTNLGLAHCDISDSGAESIKAFLYTNHTIGVIGLGGNHISKCLLAEIDVLLEYNRRHIQRA